MSTFEISSDVMSALTTALLIRILSDADQHTLDEARRLQTLRSSCRIEQDPHGELLLVIA